ncbi:DUF4129 domain-containing protein [Homoserinimonas sp. A447]
MIPGTLSGKAPADVPVDPNADEARNWILDELSEPRYEAAKPTWFDQLSSAFLDWLGSLLDGASGAPAGLLLAIVVVIIVAALVAAFLIFGMPALNRRSAVSGSLFGTDDDRSAEAMRRAADAAASAGDWALAIEEAYRAIARGLAERTILATTPGTTAHGFATRAGAAFPSLAADLAAAADTFDRVRYLGKPGSEAEYRAVAALERQLRSARVPLPAATG